MPNLGQIFTHNGGILVNAAFLLVTSAMLVGQAGGGDKKPAPPAAVAPAPVVSTGCGAGCGGCQDACGCDSFGHKLRDRLRGLFNRNSCDTCDTCKPAHTCHSHKSCDSCDSCPKAWTWQRRCHEPACNTCAPAPKACDTCSSSCGCGSHAFLDRLREGFRRNKCCDSCNTCGSACGTGPVAAPPAKVEPIAPPKKMPDPKVPDKKPAQVRIDTPPAQIPAIPTAPTVEVTPAPAAVVPVPRVEGDRRDPF
jgi:hypothetical protein